MYKRQYKIKVRISHFLSKIAIMTIPFRFVALYDTFIRTQRVIWAAKLFLLWWAERGKLKSVNRHRRVRIYVRRCIRIRCIFSPVIPSNDAVMTLNPFLVWFDAGVLFRNSCLILRTVIWMAIKIQISKRQEFCESHRRMRV